MTASACPTLTFTFMASRDPLQPKEVNTIVPIHKEARAWGSAVLSVSAAGVRARACSRLVSDLSPSPAGAATRPARV